MIAGGIVAALMVFRVPWPYVAVGAMALVSPWIGLIAVGGLFVVSVVRRRRSIRPSPIVEVEFLRELSAALGAGSTFREALASSSAGIVDDRSSRMCRVGVPLGRIIPPIVKQLPETGSAFAVLADASESVGSSVVEACHVLVEEADALRRQKGDLKVATTQARFSAIVVGVVPLLLSASFVAVRGVPEPRGATILVPMVAGAILMLVGTAVVLISSQRAVA